MQTKCLRLMGKKLLVALTLEGKFAAEGLHDIEDDDDMLSALARELVQKDGIGQTADAVWSELRQVYDQLPTTSQPLPPVEDDLPAFDSEPSTSVADVPGPMPVMTQAELLVAAAEHGTSLPTLFGQPLSLKPKAKRRSIDIPQQGSLFAWN